MDKSTSVYPTVLTLLLAISSSEILVRLLHRFSKGVLRYTTVPRGEKKDSVRKFITVQNENFVHLFFF